MSYSTTVGVDLAKNVIQISVVSSRGKELSNRSLTRKKFAEFLGKQEPSLVAFESCATAHYWARAAERYGHKAHIIPAKAVAPFRRGHKTDSNDALAVAEAARRPNIKEAPMKTVEQQGLQAIHRSRELLNQECTALSNHLRGLLMEFGIVIPKGFASLLKAVPEILEDGENELPELYRPTLHRMYSRLLELREDIGAMTKEVERLAKAHPICSKLMALEGIGPIGALLLYATMGSGAAFSGSREFAAYLGLAPKQYSSGGKTNIVGLSKKIGNSRLRSVLILGARAYVYKVNEPKSSKDKWLKANIERNGESRAAIALANKNVRTAWAMVTQGTEYQRRPQLEMAA
ncbi:MAG: IS110 family transposase [Gammaproteobacteria bacterium]|nr:IS110 family transposase [Gammaproteobacteria bacterium]MDH3834968.1 IS110 family transposase [Nitrosopumilus sp.]